MEEDDRVVFETMIPWKADEADLWDNAFFPNNEIRFVVRKDDNYDGYTIYVEGDKSRWWSYPIEEEFQYLEILEAIQTNPSVLTLLRLQFDVDYTKYWEFRE